jgi:hypothetical protein
MKNKQQFVPIEEVIAGRQHQLADAKLERLNRARLDALGYMMQASHWLDEAANDAKASLVTLANAQKLLRRRETTLEKADRALTAYLKKGGAK